VGITFIVLIVGVFANERKWDEARSNLMNLHMAQKYLSFFLIYNFIINIYEKFSNSTHINSAIYNVRIEYALRAIIF